MQDTESGLYYLRSRYYNPKTARFLTEDTASGKYTDLLSLNKYTYCHNIDTYANGLPTAREQDAADLINSKIGGGLILIAKGKGLDNLPQIIGAN